MATIAAAALRHPGLVLALVEDVQAAARLTDALTFFLGSAAGAVPLLTGRSGPAHRAGRAGGGGVGGVGQGC